MATNANCAKSNPLVTVTIDRPLGSKHPRHPDIIYPVNYGYVDGTPGGDGQMQDAYVLGVDIPIDTFTGVVIATVVRRNDVETKWVVAPQGVSFTLQQIEQSVRFMEQYFDSYVKMDCLLQ